MLTRKSQAQIYSPQIPQTLWDSSLLHQASPLSLLLLTHLLPWEARARAQAAELAKALNASPPSFPSRLEFRGGFLLPPCQLVWTGGNSATSAKEVVRVSSEAALTVSD